MSRFFALFSATALTFASNEVAAMTPYVNKAVSELPADLKSTDPIGAFVSTAKEAYTAAKADPNVVPSLTGILGAAATLALNAFALPSTAAASAAKQE